MDFDRDWIKLNRSCIETWSDPSQDRHFQYSGYGTRCSNRSVLRKRTRLMARLCNSCKIEVRTFPLKAFLVIYCNDEVLRPDAK
jgi:hypothetical protein